MDISEKLKIGNSTKFNLIKSLTKPKNKRSYKLQKIPDINNEDAKMAFIDKVCKLFIVYTRTQTKAIAAKAITAYG